MSGQSLNVECDKPLVSISLVTYNQERYIRETVRGSLWQTYSPLEVVISDDCSTDRTWDIIVEEVDAYRLSGGTHKIILNRNERNLGMVLNSAKSRSLTHGILLVGHDGDDISLPNRVERIVEEWQRGGRTATVIFHDGIKIDLDGNEIGSIGTRNSDCPLGTCTTYATRIYREFEEIKDPASFPDHVNTRRARLIGDELVFKDKLIKYRVGSGVSSVLYNRRGPELRSAIGRAASYRQTLRDLDYLYSKGKIEKDKYLMLYEKYKQCVYKEDRLVDLIDSKSFLKRFSAYWHLYVKSGLSISSFLRLPYLLPKCIGDFIYTVYGKCKYKLKKRKLRLHGHN